MVGARYSLCCMSDVTRILGEIEAGDPQAASQLLPLIYDELRKLAAQKMASERKDHTLQGTALVHEAYLRLVGSTGNEGWESRGHFFSAAAEAMRRILVESARGKKNLKNSGAMERLDLDLDFIVSNDSTPVDILEVDRALADLARENPEVAKLVELKYFAGLTLDEAAIAMGVSSRTTARYWAYAKAWLHHSILKSE